MQIQDIKTPTLDKSIVSKSTAISKAFERELKRWDKSARVEIEPLGPFNARITSDLNRWFDVEDIKIIWEECKSAIEKADTAGDIFKIEENGSGEHFVEALLSGLRPGMPVVAEAFFPTIGFDIKWKQIINRK